MEVPSTPKNRETPTHVFFLTSAFSQWYPSDFSDAQGNQFNCCEQYMMWRKAMLFGDHETAAKILQAITPDDHKSLGRSVRNFDLAVWEQHARAIVRDGNRLKFTQNPHLYDILAATAGKQLVEAAHYDPVWGIGLRAADPRCEDAALWQGKNWLGQTLTELREELFAAQFTPVRTPENTRLFSFYDTKGERDLYLSQQEFCDYYGAQKPLDAITRLLDAPADGALHLEKLGHFYTVTCADFIKANRALIDLIRRENINPQSRIFNDHVAPYERTAQIRAAEYDGIDPAKMYQPLLPHLPPHGATVLDIGAGSGRDARWLAHQGYHVVAVEPSAAFRAMIADKAHGGAGSIDVRDGMLPHLASLHASEKFDLILLGAVWQHVPPKSRKDAFNKMAAHLKPEGMIYMLLREGPPPADRKMYRVTANAAARLARTSGLKPLELDAGHGADLLGRGGVRWTSFAARQAP